MAPQPVPFDFDTQEPDPEEFTQELSASASQATEDAIKVRKTEMRRGQKLSTGRMLLTLMHKFGHTEEDARAAVSYLTGRPSVKADFRPSFGQLPPFTASQRLQASEDLRAAAEIMARTTRVSTVADDGLRKITQALTDEGYISHTTKSKAFYTTEFFKEDDDDTAFQILGWHGTGSFAGGERAILEFYDCRKSKSKPVVNIGVINDANINPAKQLEVVTHILDYVKHHG